MKRLAVAVSMLTRIPVPVRELPNLGEIARSAVFFPLVGLAIGAVMAAAYRLAAPGFDPFVAATLAVASEFFITGGLHFDGLVDTADGVMSGRGRSQALEIIHDPRAGPMGVGCGALVLLLRIALIAQIGEAGAMGGIVFAPVAARLGMVLAFVLFPSATPGKGMGSLFARKVDCGGMVIAIAYSVAAGILVVGTGAVAAVACSLAAVTVIGWCLSSCLGGVTGDVYGALCEVGSVACLAALAVKAGSVPF